MGESIFGCGLADKPDMLLGVGLPPLMLTAVEIVPALFPEAEPPPLLFSLADVLPARTPDCLPSGEMAPRAARFPCGRVAGATGPGVAESAMRVEALAFMEF